MVKFAECYQRNRRVYGPRKVWLALNRQGVPVARCTVERLMRELGLVGALRGKTVRTTVAEPDAVRARDLVDRQFFVTAPDRLWVADWD
jgi:putative transposase